MNDLGAIVRLIDRLEEPLRLAPDRRHYLLPITGAERNVLVEVLSTAKSELLDLAKK